jgi:hypothetical protein
MKKVVVALTVIVLLVVMIGADIRRPEPTPTAKVEVQPKKRCYGYTIIEFGKGINCKGDTINLVRVDGIQRMEKELASAE